MSTSNSNENVFDLLSYFKKFSTNFDEMSGFKRPDQIKGSIIYVQTLYQNSQIDPCNENLKELFENCKKAIETDCNNFFSCLYYLAKFIKDNSKIKNILYQSPDLSEKENLRKEDIDFEEKRLADLANVSNKGTPSEENSRKELQDKIIDDSNSVRKKLLFTSIKNKRTTTLELTSDKTSSDINIPKSSKDNDKSFTEHPSNEINTNLEKNTPHTEDISHINEGTELKNLTNKEIRILNNIKKLDDFCLLLNKKIKEFENKDIAFDELNSDESCYIYENNLKKRFVQVYEQLVKYCKKYPHLVSNEHKIVKIKNSQFSKKIKFDQFDKINSYITELLNKNKQFPDFCEVLEWIKEANKINDLKIEDKKISEIAKMSFEKICKILKKRRMADEFNIYQSRIEDIEKSDQTIDELEKNKNLQAKLEENRSIFNQKYTELVESYVKKQETQNLEGEEVDADEESEGDDTKSDNLEEEISEEINLSINSEDFIDARSNESESSSSEDDDQNYGTPPEPETGLKRSKNQSVDNPSKKIKLETFSSPSLNQNSDSGKKILPKIVEFSSVTAETNECIVLD